MYQTKTIDLLNTLVILNNERIQGYEIACDETDEYELQLFFEECIKTSQRCKTQLLNEIERLGGVGVTGTNFSSKLFRIWMEIKAALTGKGRISILNSCAYVENKAIEKYLKVRNKNALHLTLEQQKMLTNQSLLITADLEKIVHLRETYRKSFSM